MRHTVEQFGTELHITIYNSDEKIVYVGTMDMATIPSTLDTSTLIIDLQKQKTSQLYQEILDGANESTGLLQ